jgi:hypothetical protein
MASRPLKAAFQRPVEVIVVPSRSTPLNPRKLLHSKWTVRKYLPKRPPGRPYGDQRWATFLRNHAGAIVACDFVVAVTATVRLLYVFVFIEHGSRLVRVAVTAHPSAAWTRQQLREVVPSTTPLTRHRIGERLGVIDQLRSTGAFAYHGFRLA